MRLKVVATSISIALLAASTWGVAQAATTEPIAPIAAAKVTNPKLVELGKKLYFELANTRAGIRLQRQFFVH